ncbi:MAG: hypothetical protein ICV79_04290 [Flavisolibacter sp.]|nr:hypothetical protein [Flavisolibacter sp.]
MKNPLIILGTLLICFFASCKKERGETVTSTTSQTPTADPLKDSALLFSRELYLWYNQIPSSFNARSYEDLNKLMTAIRQYSQETGYSNPVDRWSFAMKQTEWNDISSGIAGDLGLNVFFKEEGDLRVRYVEQASPAGKAGIRRGWRITKIIGSTNITTANSNTIVQNVYNSNSTSFTFQKPDNSTVDLTLNAATYQENPFLLDTVYNISGKKIGYLVFNSFLGDTTQIKNGFNRVFNRFGTNDVSDVVVDLRYNGGGYVRLQEWLSNYLAPASANGNIMMRQEYNNKLNQYNTTTNFRKTGPLNLSRVFFIVSNNTASASEALINSLKPYMDVKLLGPSKTYGKPVGFFPYPVGDWYIFPVSSRTVNKNGNANYYNGFAVDYQLADGVDKDWGDITESCLASAINYITSGSFRLQNAEAYAENPFIKQMNEKLSEHDFKGAIESRVKFK